MNEPPLGGSSVIAPPCLPMYIQAPPLSEEEEIVWGSASVTHLKNNPPEKKTD
jgi:hypothetical protein